MLVIRDAQMRSFVAERERRFDLQMADHLAECLPEELAALEQDHALDAIASARRHGTRCGIVIESDLAILIDIVIGLGDAFMDRDQNGWLHEILENDALNGTAKMNLIRSRIDLLAAGPGQAG